MIKLIADSTCDLSAEIIEKYNIGIAPLTINIEGKVYRDKLDIKPDEFFDLQPTFKKPPTTSMPSPEEFTKLFKDAAAEGYKHILCICMSSGTSASWQSAVIARDLFVENGANSDVSLHVVDSRSMSHGSGWLIMKSARMREQGLSFEDIVKYVEENKIRVKHYLSVDDLDHLIRSGRLSNAGGFIGKLLSIKPIMSMKQGKGAIVAKERGRKKVLDLYIREFLKRNDTKETDFLIIGYTSDISVAETLKQKLLDEAKFDGEMYIMQMGVAVGTHVGPGGISMFYMEKPK